MSWAFKQIDNAIFAWICSEQSSLKTLREFSCQRKGLDRIIGLSSLLTIFQNTFKLCHKLSFRQSYLFFSPILKDKKRVWDATGLSVGFNVTNVVFNLLWSSELAMGFHLLLFGTTFYLPFGKATRMPPSMLLALPAQHC